MRGPRRPPSICPRPWAVAAPSTPPQRPATPPPPSCTSWLTSSRTPKFCTIIFSRTDRVALASVARTRLSSRSHRSTSLHTTATPGGPTNMQHLSKPGMSLIPSCPGASPAQLLQPPPPNSHSGHRCPSTQCFHCGCCGRITGCLIREAGG